MILGLRSVNFILYCKRWRETVEFYKRILGLEVLFQSDWFVEFSMGDGVKISVANEARASVKSCNGKGVTISIEVGRDHGVNNSLEELRAYFEGQGVETSPIRDHTWNARVFYITDPEGHRIEFWVRSEGT